MSWPLCPLSTLAREPKGQAGGWDGLQGVPACSVKQCSRARSQQPDPGPSLLILVSVPTLVPVS